jgi:hypothetical protein
LQQNLSTLKRHFALLLGGLILLAAACLTLNWHAANGLMNGTQNEVWHVLNAVNLWDATPWVGKDDTSLSYFLWTNYWPPGFYVFAWPVMGLFGATHQSLVLSNLGHLAILLWAVYRLGETVRGPRAGWMAMCLVVLYPSITGNLVRFEPSIALAAWVSVGALALIRSRGFSDRHWSLVFAGASAAGLMMDRLSYAFFLGIPAIVELWRGLRSGQVEIRLKHAGAALLLLLILCGYWHWHFVVQHLSEVLEQGGAGNIDSAGSFTEVRPAFALRTLLFYPAVLLDDQAGLLPGIAGLVALISWLFRPLGKDRVLASVLLSSLLVFTLIQKKQIYYTLPMLGCLAVLTSAWLVDRKRLGKLVFAVLCLAGLHQIGLRMLERPLLMPSGLSRLVGTPMLPAAWVDRDYPQARAPMWLDLPADEIVAALPEGEILLFSEDPVWTETYAVLHFRERMPTRRVWQVIGNPQRAFEILHQTTAFVTLSMNQVQSWPSAAQIDAALQMANPSTAEHWPLGQAIRQAEHLFVPGEKFSWGGGSAVIWKSRVLDSVAP